MVFYFIQLIIICYYHLFDVHFFFAFASGSPFKLAFCLLTHLCVNAVFTPLGS